MPIKNPLKIIPQMIFVNSTLKMKFYISNLF